MALKLWNNKQWQSKIGWIVTTSDKMDKAIHETGVQAMAWAELHGDVSRMVQLVQAMGRTTRIAGFLVWVEMFSPIRMKRDGTEARLGRKKGTNEHVVPFDLVTAEAHPFWTLAEAEEKTVKPLSFEAFLKIVAGYGEKLDKDDYVVKSDKDTLRSVISDVVVLLNTKRKELGVKVETVKEPKVA